MSTNITKKSSGIGKLFGILVFGGVGGLGALYALDRPKFDNLQSRLQEQLSSLMNQRNQKSSEPLKPPSKPTINQIKSLSETLNTETTKSNKDSVVVASLAMEKAKQILEAEMKALRTESEKIIGSLEEKLKLKEMQGYRSIDFVSSAFQKELENSRTELAKLEQAHKSELEMLRVSFDKLVESRVDEVTRFRLSELQSLGALVEKLRRSTGEFAKFTSLHLHTLRLVKLLNVLPLYPDARIDYRLEQDVFVKTVLENMPKNVESPAALQSAYADLKPRLKQLSLVSADGGLFSLLISRLLSPFLFDSHSKIELVDGLLAEGSLSDALDELLEMETEGWNSLVLGDFVDRLRRRVEFEVVCGALSAHLGLLSTSSVIPRLAR